MKVKLNCIVWSLLALLWPSSLGAQLPLVYEKFPGTHLRPVNCERGIVFCAHRHLQCLYQMIALIDGDEINRFG